MSKLKFRFFNGKTDDEKALVPALIMVNKRDDETNLKGVAIALGWWSWGVGFIYIWGQIEQEQTNES